MGDIIETTTAAFQPFLYYKASGNGMWFDIKTHSRALVGLGKDCGRSYFWLEFSNPGDIVFSETNQVRKSKTGLPFTLSEDNYTRFWVAWDCKSVWAGIGYTSDVVLSCPISSQFNYITFTTKDPIHPCSFRFEVPPLCLRIPPVPSEPKITAGKLEWKQCDNQLPDEAVIGGHIEGEIVYVVRAHHRDSLTPGVFVPSKGLAFIPWGGSDNPTPNFEALCGFNLNWVAASDDRIPVNAFIAGYSEVNREPIFIGRALYKDSQIPGKVQLSHSALCGFNLEWKSASAQQIPVDAFVAGYSEVRQEPLYICRASHQDNSIPGKVQLSHRTCYITHQGKEIAVRKFEVLTQPGLNIYCENEYLRPRNRLDYDFVYNEVLHGYEEAEEEEDDDVVIF